MNEFVEIVEFSSEIV